MTALIKAKEMLNRVTGFSIPIFGIQWTPVALDREAVRKFIVFLEDRRALFNPMPSEVEDDVIGSIRHIREQCVLTLGALGEKSQAAANVRAIGAACRHFLDNPYPEFNDAFERHRWRDGEREFGLRHGTKPEAFFTALGEFRGYVGAQIAVLAALYDLDIHGDLTGIIPPPEGDF